jgi:hypothetical protein
MTHFPLSPENNNWVVSNFFENLLPMLIDTGGKFVTGINGAGSKLATCTTGVLATFGKPALMMLVVNFRLYHRCQRHQ